VQVHNFSSLAVVDELEPHTAQVTFISVSADGETVATGSFVTRNGGSGKVKSDKGCSQGPGTALFTSMDRIPSIGQQWSSSTFVKSEQPLLKTKHRMDFSSLRECC